MDEVVVASPAAVDLTIAMPGVKALIGEAVFTSEQAEDPNLVRQLSLNLSKEPTAEAMALLVRCDDQPSQFPNWRPDSHADSRDEPGVPS